MPSQDWTSGTGGGLVISNYCLRKDLGTAYPIWKDVILSTEAVLEKYSAFSNILRRGDADNQCNHYKDRKRHNHSCTAVEEAGLEQANG